MFPGVGGHPGLGLITHSFHEQFPVEDYGEEHPEYYALVDGKRKLDGFYDGPQLCLSNPEVLERVTTAVMEELAENRLPGMCPSARRTATRFLRRGPLATPGRCLGTGFVRAGRAPRGQCGLDRTEPGARR